MIQRVQTLFLLLYSLIGIAYNFYFTVDPEHLAFWFTAPFSFFNFFPLVLTLVVLIVVFTYKKRKLQIRLLQGVLCLHVLFWGSFIIALVSSSTPFLGLYTLDLVLAFIGLVLLLVAIKYIRKDEALIQSLDRLR